MKIQQVELFIANFEHTLSFYRDQMEWNLLDVADGKATFQIGESLLVLHQDEESKHYYHFALNIPPNLFQSAKRWVQERVALSTEDGEDEADFTESKAKAFYFEDPAGNIIEYIARATTPTADNTQEFSPKHLVGISEIGVSASDMRTVLDELMEMGITPRNNQKIHEHTYLNFMGEAEDGNYIIVGPVGRRWIFSDKPGKVTPIIIRTDRGTFRYSV